MKRYCLHGGVVMADDGDCHYISPDQLWRLYGVSPDECVATPPGRSCRGELICLHPDGLGDYQIAASIQSRKEKNDARI